MRGQNPARRRFALDSQPSTTNQEQLLNSGDFRGVNGVQVSGEGGDLHVGEGSALGSGKGGHEGTGLAVGDPGAPKFAVGRHFQFAEIGNHGCPIRSSVTNAARIIK